MAGRSAADYLGLDQEVEEEEFDGDVDVDAGDDDDMDGFMEQIYGAGRENGDDGDDDDKEDDDDDDVDSVDIPDPNEMDACLERARAARAKSTQLANALLRRSEQERKQEEESKDGQDNSRLIDTSHRGGVIRVLPGMVAESTQFANRTNLQPMADRVTDIVLDEAAARQQAFITTPSGFYGQSIPYAICFSIPVRASMTRLSESILNLRPGGVAELASESLRVTYYFLLTIFMAMPRLTMTGLNAVPNTTMQVIPSSTTSKTLMERCVLRFMSVWISSSIREESALDKVEVHLAERKTDHAKPLDTAMVANIICMRLKSFISCPRDAILLYLDLAGYIHGSKDHEAFSCIKSEDVRKEMHNNAELRYRIVTHFHSLFHGDDVPKVMEARTTARRVEYVVLPPESTRVDMGDGIYFYPFYDILRNPLGPRASTNPDVIASGLMQVCLNFNAECEAPTSIEDALGTTTGEKTGIFNVLVKAARHPIMYRNDRDLNNSLFFNRIFDPQVNALNCMRLHRPEGPPDANPAHIDYFMQPASCLAKTGERVVCAAVQEKHNAKDDGKEICLLAAPNLVVSDKCVDDLTIPEIATDRCIYSESAVQHMMPHERGAKGRFAHLSLLFVIDPHYLKTAHSLMSSPILLEALVHRNGIEAGLSAFDRQLNTDPSNVTTAQRALVKTVRDRDERQTMGALDMQPNPWPEDTYSFDMFATQDRNVRIMRDQAKDVMDLLSLTRDTCIAKANDDGDFSLRTSLTHTQVGFMVHCLNRADKAALIRARDMVLPNLCLELEALRHTSSVNHLRSNAITGVQSLAAWRRRRAHESISHDTVKLKYRLDVNPKRKPVPVASTMCSSVSAEPDSALTNMVSSDLGVLQEFVAAIENELCYGVGIESISSMLAIYLLSVTLTTVRDIPSSVHLFLMGETTTGKTIFLQLARAVLDEMGLYSQMDKETIASSCTADDRQRMVVQAYNEVNRDCWSKPVSNAPLAKADQAPNSGGGAEHANSSQAQQMMLQCVENSKYVSNIKQPTDIARVAAGGKSAFETTNQTTNKQHSLALTANTSPRHVAPALLARFVAVPFDSIPRARNKTADESRMPYCRFMPALRNLIARANEWSNLITTARLLPGVDTAMVAPVAVYLNKKHMELTQKAGCIPAFRTTAAPGRTPPLETSRLKKQLMRTIESMCHARLTLTLMNTLAPTLAAVGECWDEPLMNATVALCSIANVEDLSVAYGLFNNFDMTCRSMDVIKHTTNLLDNVVQAFLYCLHHKAVQYEGGNPNSITKVIPTSVRASQPVHPIKIKSARQAARKSKVIAAMRQLPATAFREPAFAWVAQCALEWARSEHMTILVCVLSQTQSMPLHHAHLNQPQVQGEDPMHPTVKEMTRSTVACAAFWYVVEQAYQVVRDAWIEFRGPDASPEPQSQPLPSGAGAGAGAGASSSEYNTARFDRELGEDPLAEEKSDAMDRILAFGTHLQTRSDFAVKPILIPRVGYYLMFPLQVVTHPCIMGQKDKTTFMRADVLNQTLPYNKLKHELDPHRFYHNALSGLERFTLKSALASRRPPAAAAASGSATHVGDSTGRSKDNTPQELRYDATNGMDPSYLAKKVGEDSGNVELDGRLLINMGVLRVSTVICDTRHLALDPRTVDNSTDTPTAAAWRQLHESLSSRTARQADGSPVPQIFDRNITVLTHRLRDTMGVTELKRIKPKETDYYEDDGVATRQHLVRCMRELSQTPPDQPLDVSKVNTRVDRGRVTCGKHDSLLQAAFSTRCTAFPVLFSAVRTGLMRVAEKHFERLNQRPTVEKCATFVKDLFQALLFTPRDFCMKYQHLDKNKLKEYPECMPEGKAHVVPIKTAGSSMDDLFQGDVAGDTGVVLGAKRSRSFNTAAYERRMQKARRATGNAASRMGSMVMERRDAQNRDAAAMMQVDAEERHQDYDDMGRPIV